MSAKVYMVDDDASPNKQELAEKTSKDHAHEFTSLEEIPPERQLSDNSVVSVRSSRTPSFKRRQTFLSSRQDQQKIKSPRMIFRNHASRVTRVAYLDNYHRPLEEFQDTLLISGGEDKRLYINSLQLGITRMKMSGHTQRISGIISCSATGYPHCVISCSWDETIKIWKVGSCFTLPKKDNKVLVVNDSWKTLTGHTNRICCVKLFNAHDESSDSRLLLASGSTDGSIMIWNFKLVNNEDIDTDCLHCIVDELNITWYLCLDFVYTPQDGNVIISGSKDNFVRLWNIDSIISGGKKNAPGNSKPLRVIKGHESKIRNVCVTSESVSGDILGKASDHEHRIVTTCLDLTVRIFSLEGVLLRTLNDIPTPITGLAIRDSIRDKSDIIITAGLLGGIRVWRSLTGELLHVFNGYPGPCNSVVAFPSPDVKGDVVVYSGGDDNTSRLFLYSIEKCLRILKHNHIDNPENIVKVNVVKPFIQDGIVSPLIFAGCNDGTVWCWLLNKGEDDAVVQYTNCVHSSRIRALAIYLPPQSIPADVIDENEIVESNAREDIDDESALKLLPVAFTPMDSSETRTASTFDLNLTQCLLLSAGRDRDIMITSIDSGIPVARIIEAETHSITSLDIYSDTNSDIDPFIVSGSESNNARIFSLKHGNLIQVLEGHEFDVTCVKVFIPKCKPKPKSRNASSASVSRSTSRQSSARGENPNVIASSNVRNPIILSSSMDNTIIVWIYDLATKCYVKDAELTDSSSYLSCVDVCQLDDKAVIAAGNGDGDIYLWSVMNQMEIDQRDIEYRLSFVYTGCHTDEIFGIAMYNPEGLPPILTSGSGDNTVVLWSLETYEQLQVIEGHDGDITSVSLFAPGCSDPFLATSSIDGTVRVVSEFLGNLPNGDAVELAYSLDEKDKNETWSRIAVLVQKFQADNFFQLYYYLFFKALESGLSSFLTKFLPLSLKALVRTNAPQRIDMRGFDNNYVLQSLLRLAMEKDNAPAIHVIVSCWMGFFSRKVSDGANDLFYDEKHNICRDDLLMLASGYASEFSRLICSISLIPLEKNELLDGEYLLDVGPEDSMDLLRSDSADPATSASPGFAHATEKKGSQDAGHDDYTFLSLPLKDLCHISMMKMYVSACLSTDDASIFDSEVGILTLAYCWRLYGRNYHIYSMKIYMLYALVSSVTLFSFKSTKDDVLLRYIPIASMITQLVLAVYFFSTEIRQLCYEGLAYFEDIWNMNDAIVTSCGIIGNALRLIYWGETEASRVLLSLAIICSYFKILFYLRAFETTGPLVSMIVQIWKDMQATVGIIALVIIGFSQAFWLLSEVDESLPFASIQNSFLNSYSFMLGGYDPTAFDGAPLQSWATFLAVIYMLVMNLLLLNLLIALMGNTYAVVEEKGNAQWRLEQTQVVLDHASQLKDEVKTHSMVYVRKRSEVLKRIQDEQDSNADDSIKASIEAMGKSINELKQSLDKLSDKMV